MAKEYTDHVNTGKKTENNFVERDEDEMPVLSGAVLHILSSNGIRNHEVEHTGIIQAGKIIKNHNIVKRKNNNHDKIQKNNIKKCENGQCKNGLKDKKTVNGLNGLDIDNIPGTSSDNKGQFLIQNHKVQNGMPEVNGLESKKLNGDVAADNSSNKEESNGERSPVVRPKVMSWSRMVKQRKENKLKERNGRRNKRSCRGYIYPELCSSSEESSDDNIKSKNKNSDVVIKDNHNNCESVPESIKSLCNRTPGYDLSDVNNARHLPSQQLGPIRNQVNRRNGHVNNSLISQPNLSLLAPLAVPEDSDTGRSSISSEGRNSDLVVENNISKSTSQENIQQDLANENLETATESHDQNRAVLEQNILPLSRNRSIDSLEEIGDYIETDFPSKASRLLFQSSSRSSSPSTDDDDEGFRGSKSKDNNIASNNVTEQSLAPAACAHNVTSHNINPAELRLKIEQNVPSSSKLNYDQTTHQARRIARLSSGAGSESERGGIFGSDSSYVYTPETDYQDFLDSDLPSSDINMAFQYNNHDNSNNDREYVLPRMENFNEDYNDAGASVQPEGAEGGMTNNLNVEGRCSAFDYLDSNMEVYDPHCDQPDDDNYLLRVIYKHEKVPIANFQNSEDNKQEKIFCKHALDGDHPLSHGSSDEEENAFHHYGRDVASLSGNVEPSCMVVEDLENLTHALQNAVIMHLPSQMEDSSDESCEEPIYEEIDNLDSLLSTSDNSLHIVEEEPGSLSKVNTIPKYERRRHRRSRGSDVDKVMIWNEYEAYVLQVKQIGTSACGPTAVLNIMKAFDYNIDKDEVCKKIPANLRMEAAPIPYYLFSRYNAGTTAEVLMDGISKLTKGTIRGRFFHFYPARKVELLKWLGYWMRKGAVPLATLNLQRGVKPGWTIPDAWHHQMIYGVSSKGVYLTNPLEIVPESTIMEQLTSDSILLIRRQDVVNRFRDWAPLNEFLKKSDTRWQSMNVLGQVVNVLREACTALSHQGPRYRAQLTSHITIPAAYKAGITLYVRHNTEVCQELFNASELELLNPEYLEDAV